MNEKWCAVILALGLVSCNQEAVIESNQNMELKPYPQTEKIDHVDNYFGVDVQDPYRWLEDDLSDKTKAWVTAQNEVTQHYLSQIPFRDAIKSRLEKLWNFERYSAPFTEGEYNYFYKNDLIQIPFRDAIKSRLEKLWNFERYSAPFTEGEYTYFYKNDGLQNQAVLYRRKGDGPEEVFLDPNKFSADGTTSLAGISFNK